MRARLLASTAMATVIVCWKRAYRAIAQNRGTQKI